MPEPDFTDAIVVLEWSDDIILARYVFSEACSVPYDDRERWPDTQHTSHRSSSCAVKSQIQTTWRCKHGVSPSLAHMHQHIPRIIPKPSIIRVQLNLFVIKLFVLIQAQGEDFKEDVVGECFDSHVPAYRTFVIHSNSVSCKGTRPVITHVVGFHCSTCFVIRQFWGRMLGELLTRSQERTAELIGKGRPKRRYKGGEYTIQTNITSSGMSHVRRTR